MSPRVRARYSRKPIPLVAKLCQPDWQIDHDFDQFFSGNPIHLTEAFNDPDPFKYLTAEYQLQPGELRHGQPVVRTVPRDTRSWEHGWTYTSPRRGFVKGLHFASRRYGGRPGNL